MKSNFRSFDYISIGKLSNLSKYVDFAELVIGGC